MMVTALRMASMSCLVIWSDAAPWMRIRDAVSIIEAPNGLRGRLLNGATVTTSDCSAIRLAPYPAELQLSYEYSVEFKPGRAVSLKELARAIANQVAHQLDMCDNLGRPVYKVKTDSQHRFSEKVCMPKVNESNGCIVVAGKTTILLDSDSAFVRSVAFDAIENGLTDADSLLQGYTDAVVGTEYLSKPGKALLLEAGQEDPGEADGENDSSFTPITATIAAAAASVSFVVATIVCYGYMRKDSRQHPEPSVRHKAYSRKSSTRTIVSDSLGARTRRHFVRLEDLSGSPTSLVTATMTPSTVDYAYAYPEQEEYGVYEENYSPSVTWSVSDVTWSDCASVRSNLSRTPSMLERIEEEEEEDHGDNTKLNSSESKRNFRSGRSRPIQTAGDFDCKSLHQDQMLDISDLDACYTIVPDETSKREDSHDGSHTDESQAHSDPNNLELPTSEDRDNIVDSSVSDKSESSVLDQVDEPIDEQSEKSGGSLQGSEKEESEVAESTSSSVDCDHYLAQERIDTDGSYAIATTACRDAPASPTRDQSGDENGFDDDSAASADFEENSIEQNQDDDSFVDGASLDRERMENVLSIGSASDDSVVSGCSVDSEEQEVCFEASTNVEDSIDVWVEELLEQKPRDDY